MTFITNSKKNIAVGNCQYALVHIDGIEVFIGLSEMFLGMIWYF